MTGEESKVGDEDVREAWAAEIKRRLEEADADPTNDEDWREALDDIRRGSI
jgi:hypothetical protein